MWVILWPSVRFTVQADGDRENVLLRIESDGYLAGGVKIEVIGSAAVMRQHRGQVGDGGQMDTRPALIVLLWVEMDAA